jgi:peroxiredoxin
VAVIGLHASGISAADLKAFAKQHGLTYPIGIDSEDGKHANFGQTMTDYSVQGIPTVAVVDRKGVLRFIGYGLDEAIRVVGELLAAERH